MRQYILFLLFSFLTLSSAFSQMSQLEKETIDYEKGKGFYIEKARKILTTSLQSENWEEVKRAQTYIKGLEDDDFFGLFAGEDWLILFWTKDYSTILDDARAFTAENMLQYSLKLEPDNDKLQNTLMSKTLRSKNKLIDQINKAELNQEEKTFLLLLLKNLTTDIDANLYLQDDINDDAISFMADYPESEYIPFIKHYIHYKLKASKLGIGLEVFTGVGYYTQDLFERYNNVVPFGFTLNAAYEKYNVYFRQYWGFATTKTYYQKSNGLDIGSYPIGSRIKNNITDLAFGYSILNHSTLKAVPFASIGGMGFKAPNSYVDDAPELAQVANIDYQFAAGLGLNLDFKIGVDRTPKFMTQSSYGYVRLRYNYYMPFFNDLTGGLHCITIGFGGIGHLTERDL